jgi:hypothetical protein
LTRRLALALLLTALAGCGHDSKEAPAGSAAQPPAPSAHPTRAEYRAIVREYRALRPLSSGQNDDLARGRRICAALTHPDTKLIRLVRADCDNAIDYFAALHGVEHAIDDCATDVAGKGIPCARERYRALAAAVAQTRRGGVALNNELAHRGITGLCARSIGMTAQQVAGYRAAERYASDAARLGRVRTRHGRTRRRSERGREQQRARGHREGLPAAEGKAPPARSERRDDRRLKPSTKGQTPG